MLQFDGALCHTRDNVAHLSALVTRQAGKVRRYRNRGSVGVYLRRWARPIPNVKGEPPLPGSFTAIVSARPCNRVSPIEILYFVLDYGRCRLRRISAFLLPASWEALSGGLL